MADRHSTEGEEWLGSVTVIHHYLTLSQVMAIQSNLKTVPEGQLNVMRKMQKSPGFRTDQ
jgi:hypothetical protein